MKRGLIISTKTAKTCDVLYETTAINGQVSADYNMPIKFDTTTRPVKRTYLIDNAKAVVPGIVSVVNCATGYDLPWGHPETLQVGEKIVKMNGSRVGAAFFNMFNYPIIAGNTAATALSNRGGQHGYIAPRQRDIFSGARQMLSVRASGMKITAILLSAVFLEKCSRQQFR